MKRLVLLYFIINVTVSPLVSMEQPAAVSCSCVKNSKGFAEICEFCRLKTTDPEQFNFEQQRLEFHQDILSRERRIRLRQPLPLFIQKRIDKNNCKKARTEPLKQAKKNAPISTLACLASEKLSGCFRKLNFQDLQEYAAIRKLEFSIQLKHFNKILCRITRDIILEQSPPGVKIDKSICKDVAATIIDAYVSLIKSSSACACYYGMGWNPGFHMCAHCKKVQQYYPDDKMVGSFLKAKREVKKGILSPCLTNDLTKECIEQLNAKIRSSEEEQLLKLFQQKQ